MDRLPWMNSAIVDDPHGNARGVAYIATARRQSVHATSANPKRMRPDHTLFVYGATYGSGKSALASRIAHQQCLRGSPATCVHEADVPSLSEFQPFWRAMLANDPRMVDALYDGARQFAARAPSTGVWITDTVVPLVHWLLWGDQPTAVVEAFARWIDEFLTPLDPVLVYLDCSTDQRRSRVAAHRGDAWIRTNDTQLRRFPLGRRIGESAAREHVERECRRIVRTMTWRSVYVDTGAERIELLVSRVLRDAALGGMVPMPAFSSADVAQFAGRYSTLEATEPVIELKQLGSVLVLVIGTATAPLLIEHERWRIEGVNAWLTPDRETGRVRYESITRGVREYQRMEPRKSVE